MYVLKSAFWVYSAFNGLHLSAVVQQLLLTYTQSIHLNAYIVNTFLSQIVKNSNITKNTVDIYKCFV